MNSLARRSFCEFLAFCPFAARRVIHVRRTRRPEPQPAGHEADRRRHARSAKQRPGERRQTVPNPRWRPWRRSQRRARNLSAPAAGVRPGEGGVPWETSQRLLDKADLGLDGGGSYREGRLKCRLARASARPVGRAASRCACSRSSCSVMWQAPRRSSHAASPRPCSTPT